jgi:hypothetical protein
MVRFDRIKMDVGFLLFAYRLKLERKGVIIYSQC